MINYNIRKANEDDASQIVDLAILKQQAYMEAQPKNFRRAAPLEEQIKYIKQQLENKDVFIFVAEKDAKIIGFIEGAMLSAPAFYSKDSHTMIVRELAVKEVSLLPVVGKDLIAKLKKASNSVVNMAIECGFHDKQQQKFLKSLGFSISTQWYVRDSSDL